MLLFNWKKDWKLQGTKVFAYGVDICWTFLGGFYFSPPEVYSWQIMCFFYVSDAMIGPRTTEISEAQFLCVGR